MNAPNPYPENPDQTPAQTPAPAPSPEGASGVPEPAPGNPEPAPSGPEPARAVSDASENAAKQPQEPGADLLAVISGVEQQLQYLKHAHSETEFIRAQMAEREQALKHRERELEESRQALRAAEDRARQVEARAAELERQSATLEEREQRVAARAQAMSRQIESLDQAGAEQARIQQELARRASETERLEAEIAQLKQHIEQLRAGSDGLLDRLREAEAQAGRVVAAEEQARACQTEVDRLNGLLQTPAAAEAAVADLQDALDAREEALVRLKQKLDGMSAERGELERQRDQAAAALAQSQEEFRRRIANLESALESALTQAAQPPAERAPSPDERIIAARRDRLRAVQSELKVRSNKLKSAAAALQVRFQQCERILSQREELAKARQSLLAMQARLDKQHATVSRNKSGSLVFFMFATLAILAALSWGVAGVTSPMTYAATVVLGADTPDGPPGPGVLEEWQRFHENLLTDPKLIETAAERMDRRGVVSLSTPGALRDRMLRDMTHQSTAPGTLSVELRGPSADRTRRELEIIATSLVSEANATRMSRSDGLGVRVQRDAAAGAEPIDDQRLVYAGGIFGGSTLLSLIIGGIVWRRLSAAKQKFDQEDDIEDLLEPARWGIGGDKRQSDESEQG